MKVTNVEVKQVDMPESMLRAMAEQAEAERKKGSKIIHAESECWPRNAWWMPLPCGEGTGQRAVAVFADVD